MLVYGCGLAVRTGLALEVDLALYPDVGARLDLKLATLGVAIELIGQRELNVTRARVVALDEVAVVAVHHAHQIGQARTTDRMQARTELRRGAHELGNDICERDRRAVEQAGLDACRSLEGHATLIQS